MAWRFPLRVGVLCEVDRRAGDFKACWAIHVRFRADPEPKVNPDSGLRALIRFAIETPAGRFFVRCRDEAAAARRMPNRLQIPEPAVFA
ncbi:MAG TPA: hypothetical protein VIL84_00745 [Devosiaceae bacterium]